MTKITVYLSNITCALARFRSSNCYKILDICITLPVLWMTIKILFSKSVADTGGGGGPFPKFSMCILVCITYSHSGGCNLKPRGGLPWHP